METTTARFTGKCKGCRKGHSTLALADGLDMARSTKCECGKRVRLEKVLGGSSVKQCNALCQNSTGFLCDCSCGGLNHGKSYDHAAA